MKKRIQQKISKRMELIDSLMVFAIHEGYWSEIPSLRKEMKNLGRRWPRIYGILFYDEWDWTHQNQAGRRGE